MLPSNIYTILRWMDTHCMLDPMLTADRAFEILVEHQEEIKERKVLT